MVRLIKAQIRAWEHSIGGKCTWRYQICNLYGFAHIIKFHLQLSKVKNMTTAKVSVLARSEEI